jgi:hypothetical protein
MSDKTWTVWVNGSEVIDYYVTLEEAKRIEEHYVAEGYDEVFIDKHTQEEINGRKQ